MNVSVLIKQVRFVASMRSWMVALGLLLPMFAHGQSFTYLVGSDAPCDFATIQSAIDAAQAHPGPDAIHIARNATYTAQAISIGAQELTLVGGFDTCASAQSSGTTTISGAGGSAVSVFTITGNAVVSISSLTISGGDESFDGNGGGIDYNGVGNLLIANTTIQNNYAGYGGGIRMRATAASELHIGANTLILSNTAQFSGGGVRLEGPVRMFMLGDADASSISFNEALGTDPATNQPRFGTGGGIEVLGPARIDIGSPGAVFVGAVSGNTARRGGGIAVLAREGSATARLFTTSPSQPLTVSNNSASERGGAFYLNSDAGARTGASLCLYDFRVDGNSAPVGAAIYANYDEDFWFATSVYINPAGNCGPESPASLGAVDCSADAPCNEMSGNATLDDNGQTTSGALIDLHVYDTFSAERVSLHDNNAGRAVYADKAFSGRINRLSDCLIADNQFAEEAIYFDEPFGSAAFTIDNCTFAHNTIGAAHVFRANGFVLTNSIIDQPGTLTLNYSGSPDDLDVAYVLSSDLSTLPGSTSIVNAAPRFIDPARRDYHLRAGSPGVDFAPPVVGDDRDLDGLAHDQDLALVPDRFGDRDLGAYERQDVGNLVLNPGFLTDLNLWTVVTPGSAVWQGAGASDAGSVRVAVTPPPAGNEVVGLSHCVAVPGPGVYQLDGLAFGEGSGFTRDHPRLRWKYWANSNGENCSGVQTGEGDVLFGGASTFAPPLAPGIVNVPANEWTRFSKIEVSLVVREGSNVSGVGGTGGQFDDIVLRAVLDDLIFKDGFDGL